MLSEFDNWKPEVVKLLNADKSIMGSTIYETIAPDIYQHALNNSTEWIDYITNYCSVSSWNAFMTAKNEGKENEFDLAQAKLFKIFLDGFRKYLTIKDKKNQLNNEFLKGV